MCAYKNSWKTKMKIWKASGSGRVIRRANAKICNVVHRRRQCWEQFHAYWNICNSGHARKSVEVRGVRNSFNVRRVLANKSDSNREHVRFVQSNNSFFARMSSWRSLIWPSQMVKPILFVLKIASGTRGGKHRKLIVCETYSRDSATTVAPTAALSSKS